jgi:hypothetical protein
VGNFHGAPTQNPFCGTSLPVRRTYRECFFPRAVPLLALRWLNLPCALTAAIIRKSRPWRSSPRPRHAVAWDAVLMHTTATCRFTAFGPSEALQSLISQNFFGGGGSGGSPQFHSPVGRPPPTAPRPADWGSAAKHSLDLRVARPRTPCRSPIRTNALLEVRGAHLQHSDAISSHGVR